MTDEQVLHLAPAVDEHGVGILLQEFLGFPGFEMFHGSFARRKIQIIVPWRAAFPGPPHQVGTDLATLTSPSRPRNLRNSRRFDSSARDVSRLGKLGLVRAIKTDKTQHFKN